MGRLFVLVLLFLLMSCTDTSNVFSSNVTNSVISDFLDRIGGENAAEKFVVVIDECLSEDGKDVFVITSKDEKPCIKGSSILAVTTGINWYLNHYAHINLSWNQLVIDDLAGRELPLPSKEERHICDADYRYYLN